MARIVISSGPAAGKAFPLEGQVDIGRDASCGIVINDDKISRTHARVLRNTDGSWIIRDLGSANGSWLTSKKGQRERLSGDQVLRDGDQVELGDKTRLSFALNAAAHTAVAGPIVRRKRTPAEKLRRFAMPLAALAVGTVFSLAALGMGSGATPAQACSEKMAADTIRDSTVWIIGFDDKGQSVQTGTGFVLREDGYILTNRHVIMDAKNQPLRSFTVVLAGQERQLPAQVVRYDDAVDLALLKADGIPNLKAVSWAKSAALQPGDEVITAGFPADTNNRTSGSPTFTFGRMSALRVFQGAQFLQHDADINPGNSGGPLVNICGAVVGVNTQVAYVPGQTTRAPGINFSVASSDAQRLADQWLPIR